ncbi:hypothetical protein R6L23_34570 [Streptomyces sp. SR27]|uniref:hypothetical protein n=1 Tax=Streptomyces sp. SR27 TaxID=3076630 RepID=UPI00295B3695|nr:hypothetical protein [Streptomyces sp. SR27]MDV9193277.1 hypothetical protein [Streptomyces sp. SR27]
MGAWRAFALQNGGFSITNPGRTAAMIHLPPQEPPLSDTAHKLFHEDIRATCGPVAEAAVTLVEALAEGEPEDLPPHIHCRLAGALLEGQRGGATNALANWTAGYATATGWEVYSEASSPRSLARWRHVGMLPAGQPIRLPDSRIELTPIITHGHATSRARREAHTATN